MLGLDIAYLYTKFDHCSFSRFRDMVGANQNLNGSCDLITPLSGKVCYPWASTCNERHITKFEVSIFAQHEDMKGDTKRQNWGGLG